jgi:hypothetical protein
MEGTCVNCGLLLAVGDTYCGNCGQPTSATVAAPTGAGWPNSRNGPMPTEDSRNGPMPTEAAAGQRTPNAQYLGLRLIYDKEPEASFDPLGNPRLLVQFVRHALQYFALYFLGGFVSVIVLLFLHLLGLSVGIAVTLGAAAAPVAFEHITWAIRRRETPLDLIQVRHLNLAGGQGRDYLELRRALFTGFISCFAYGQDLYVGWTFYLRISPLRYLLMALARAWQTLKRQGTDLYVTLRFDYARAMREAIHSVAREGIDVAIGQVRPQGQGIIGETVKVAVTTVDT